MKKYTFIIKKKLRVSVVDNDEKRAEDKALCEYNQLDPEVKLAEKKKI